MGNMIKDRKRFFEILLILNVFFIPISLPLGTLFSTLILITWLFSGDYRNKINNILNNKVFLFSAVFFLLHLIGFLWSSDLKEALAILRKHRWFLIIPATGFYIEKYNIDIRKLFNTYIISNCVTMFFSYLMFFGVDLPEVFIEEAYCYTPFHHHVDHTILIAIASYFLLRKIFIEKITLIAGISFVLLYIVMVHNMIITLGRAGQVTMFIGIFFVFLEFFKENIVKGITVSLLLSVFILTGLYGFNDSFRNRINAGFNDIRELEHNQNTSLGLRSLYWKNALDIWKQSGITIIKGVGTGDFTVFFEKLHNERHPELQLIKRNPHNYYVLLLARFGLIGVLFLSILFIYMFIYCVRNYCNYPFTGLFIIFTYLFICIFEIYLQRHFLASSFSVLVSSVFIKRREL